MPSSTWRQNDIREDVALDSTPRPVLKRFRQVRGIDLRCAGQVGDGAGQLEHPVVAARRKLQLLHRLLNEQGPLAIQPAVFGHFTGAEVGIAGIRQSVVARTLALTRALDARPDRLRGFSVCRSTQFGKLHARHFDVNINPVQKRPGDPLLIACDRSRRARAILAPNHRNTHTDRDSSPRPT